MIVLLTDGEATYPANGIQNAKNNNIAIYTVGLGSGVNSAMLQRIASETGGEFFAAANSKDLVDYYTNLSVWSGFDSLDTDGDGIPDIIETVGMKANGKLLNTDPLNADTDGDGLKDGEEIEYTVQIKTEYEQVGPYSWRPVSHTATPIIKMISDPTKEDSDGDGLLDGRAKYENGVKVAPKDYRPMEANGTKEAWGAYAAQKVSGEVPTEYAYKELSLNSSDLSRILEKRDVKFGDLTIMFGDPTVWIGFLFWGSDKDVPAMYYFTENILEIRTEYAVNLIQHIRYKMLTLTESEAHHYLLDHGLFLSGKRILEDNLTIAQIIQELDKIEAVASEFLDLPVELLNVPEFASAAAFISGMYNQKIGSSELKNLLLILSAVIGDSHEFAAFILDFIPDTENNGFYPTYHSHPDSTFIRYCGYNDLVDKAFETASTMRRLKYTFVGDSGKETVIWGWKGDYWMFGPGSEIGVYEYYAPIKGTNYKHYDVVEGEFPMTLHLFAGENYRSIFSWEPTLDQWWVSGFDSAAGISFTEYDKLTTIGTVDFSGRGNMFERAKASFNDDINHPFHHNIVFDDEEQKVWIVWDYKLNNLNDKPN
jgi:hypothetical protein